MVWRAYYLIKKDNYLKISTLLICIFSVFAIILNIEGSNCIVQIDSSPIFSNSSNENKEVGNNSDFKNQGAEVKQQQGDEQQQQQQQQQGDGQQQEDANTQSQEALMQQSYELRKYCFLVTNLCYTPYLES